MICCIPFRCFVLCIPGNFSVSLDEVGEMSEMLLPKLVMDSVEFMMSYWKDYSAVFFWIVEIDNFQPKKWNPPFSKHTFIFWQLCCNRKRLSHWRKSSKSIGFWMDFGWRQDCKYYDLGPLPLPRMLARREQNDIRFLGSGCVGSGWWRLYVFADVRSVTELHCLVLA